MIPNQILPDPDAASLLRERYGYLRAEILQRLDSRYKVLTGFVALLAIGFTVIIQLKWDAIAFPMCVATLALAAGIKGENRRIQLISDYLIRLERELDKHYGLVELKGWEQTARSMQGTKISPSTQMGVAASAVLTFFYGTFAFIAVRWAMALLEKDFQISGWFALSSLVIGVSMPLVLFLVFFWIDYRKYSRGPHL